MGVHRACFHRSACPSHSQAEIAPSSFSPCLPNLTHSAHQLSGVGNFYDREGERQHPISLAATPAYGKATFLDRLEAEVSHVKAKYPRAHDAGIADGTQGNWESLKRHTDTQVVDSWHAAEYLGKAAAVLYRGRPATRQSWTDASCHTLNHEPGGAAMVLKQLRSSAKVRPWARDNEDVQRAITYFTNRSGAGRMDYAARVAKKEPIGSGVTEAACKVVVKQRLCCSGMKWKESGAAAVLSLLLEPHDGKMGPVLVEDRPMGFPGGSVNHRRLQMLSYINRRSHPPKVTHTLCRRA